MRVPLPREHGAWGMLYVPSVIAALTLGEFSIKLVLFFICITAAFLAHEPLVTLLRLDPRPENQEKRRNLRFWLASYLIVAAASILPLVILHHLWLLALLGAITSLFLLVHVYLVSELTQRNIMAEFLGVLCLTSSAPATCYVVVGHFEETAFLLWGLSILYFSSSIFYVKMRVSRYARKPDASRLRSQCVAYHLFLAGCLFAFVWPGNGSVIAALAFLPVLVRAFYSVVSTDERLNLKQIGLAEVAYSLIFVLLMSAGLMQRR